MSKALSYIAPSDTVPARLAGQNGKSKAMVAEMGAAAADRLRAKLEQAVMLSPVLRPIVERWPAVDLPGGWLVAGALTQTLWNHVHGLPPGHGIKDVDIIYFRPGDLSAEREASDERRLRHLFRDLAIDFDVKNEARVHLWYESRFGFPIAPYTSTEAAIASFPTTATAIGIRPSHRRLEICAPFGLDDLMGLIVRPNKTQVTRQVYDAKVARWRHLWPRLHIIGWDSAQPQA